MALHDGEYEPAGPLSEYEMILGANAEAYLSEQAVVFLSRGFDRLADREFCVACPAALLCAAAEHELNRLVPNTRRDVAPWRRQMAARALSGMSITTVDHPDAEDICFSKVVRAIEHGILLEPADTPSSMDPLDPVDRQLLWLADRVRTFIKDVAGRLASGQHL
ncbi:MULTISPECIES: hypothetical protein [unclassified Gordonia (in: high G+C Gram-positive bacteria)]|uniref:hypothetical protein n=1 Tax=unclassified Gordonia (in: high G+C Gram-positive bacteria) TaxID=2657482 RepID=UPI001F0F7F72|nr:hypothetical protein [Gordonia sp. ABSL49_1]MCH5645599.1 hypothetical protein [Gordonia sp. ABSL49_1]